MMSPRMKIWYFHEQNENEFDTHCLPAFFFSFQGDWAWHGRIGFYYGGVFFLVGIILEIYASFLKLYRSTYETVRNYAMQVCKYILVVCRASNRPTMMWIDYAISTRPLSQCSRAVSGPSNRVIFSVFRLFVFSSLHCFIVSSSFAGPR
jgi:hypothetical protein